MANPYGWQQVNLNDTGTATQMAVRTAQQATSNIMNIAEGYQNNKTTVEKSNAAAQQVLNNRKLSQQIQESGLSAEEFAKQQSTGSLAGSNLTEQYGINYDAAGIQQQVDAKQVELAEREIANIIKIDKNKADIENQGVPGLLSAKARLLSLAKTGTQRSGIEAAISGQMDIAVSKRNEDIINRALGKSSQVEGGQGYGGLFADGLSRTVDIEEFARNQAAKYQYNTKQTNALLAELAQREAVSRQLKPAEQSVYEAITAEHSTNLGIARTHLVGRMDLVNQDLTRATADWRSVNLDDKEYSNKQLVDTFYDGKADADDVAKLFSRVAKYTGNLSQGRIRAIQSHILSNAKNLDDVTTDQIILSVDLNKEKYPAYQSGYLRASNQYTDINNKLKDLNKEDSRFKVVSAYNISKGRGGAKTPKLDSYLAELDAIGRTSGEVLTNEIAKAAVPPLLDRNPGAEVVVPTSLSNMGSRLNLGAAGRYQKLGSNVNQIDSTTEQPEQVNEMAARPVYGKNSLKVEYDNGTAQQKTAILNELERRESAGELSTSAKQYLKTIRNKTSKAKITASVNKP